MAVGREQIVTSAIQHLNKSPTASMAQVAEAAGVSRATLHRHFTSREELLEAMGTRALDAWEAVQQAVNLHEALKNPDAEAVERTLRDLLAGLVEVADEHGFALTDYILEEHPGLQARCDELETHEIDLITAAQRLGVLRADLPARWVSNTVYGVLVTVRESLRRGDIARRDASRLAVETFMHGTGGHHDARQA
ncbi:TetR/AcrR family transcriptional regulator [Nonomuraea sp. NPDC050556]|uniref:TetR/AcrR family transcriptional regulator n=1 Tax=Nonomuraea sp. NPDC050556 TaxID=3364369 RepID=UPI003790C6B7